MSTITQEELSRLATTVNASEWNAICDAVKKAHGGYPDDWYKRVVLSGLARAAELRQGRTEAS